MRRRPGGAGDVPAMVGLVGALAEYERAADQVRVTTTQMSAALFGEDPKLFAHVAEHDGSVVGMARWFAVGSAHV